MVMHEAYSSVRKAWPNWRGWLTAFFVALFLLPVAALASGMALAAILAAGVMLLMALAALYLATWALWKALSKKALPFSFSFWAALASAFLLALLAVYVIPLYGTLYASFGNDLPASTAFLWQYHYLLLAPALAIPLLLYWIKRRPHRERYVDGLMAVEIIVLMLCMFVMQNFPIKMG